MLVLLFNRFPKRYVIGLLALGEWGVATGAVTGSCSTQQTGQQDLCSGTVLEPIVVGGGGGGGGESGHPAPIPAIAGAGSSVQAAQYCTASGDLIFAGVGATLQRAQGTHAAGAVAIRGSCATAQRRQQSQLSGSLELVGNASSVQQCQNVVAAGELGIVGAVATRQAPQCADLAGRVVPARVAREAISAVSGSARTRQTSQECALVGTLGYIGEAATFSTQVVNLSGEMVDTELEMVTAILMQAA